MLRFPPPDRVWIKAEGKIQKSQPTSISWVSLGVSSFCSCSFLAGKPRAFALHKGPAWANGYHLTEQMSKYLFFNTKAPPDWFLLCFSPASKALWCKTASVSLQRLLARNSAFSVLLEDFGLIKRLSHWSNWSKVSCIFLKTSCIWAGCKSKLEFWNSCSILVLS